EADIIINFPIKVTNQYIVPSKFTNECILEARNPIITKSKISKSNKAKVRLELASSETRDTSIDKKLINFYYCLYLYYCCCLCNG
ncbi:hypothetical protein, partial [uncultured Clostridium sp.]